jgi:hypothetical protein
MLNIPGIHPPQVYFASYPDSSYSFEVTDRGLCILSTEDRSHFQTVLFEMDHVLGVSYCGHDNHPGRDDCSNLVMHTLTKTFVGHFATKQFYLNFKKALRNWLFKRESTLDEGIKE